MLGAIIGDIVGSVYEWNNIKTKDFPLFNEKCTFTDDTVMTLAIAVGMKNGGNPETFTKAMRSLGRQYPNAGYGGKFAKWLRSNRDKPYNSYGNGSAMRVSPIGWMHDSLYITEKYAEISASVTHNHPEGIKGAQATASAIFLARTGKSKTEIKKYIQDKYEYNLDRTLNEIRPSYVFDVSCHGTVPEAIIAFLESNSFEDALRNAISLGGDSDTLASITGSIAEASYSIPEEVKSKALTYLPQPLLSILLSWQNEYLWDFDSILDECINVFTDLKEVEWRSSEPLNEADKKPNHIYLGYPIYPKILRKLFHAAFTYGNTNHEYEELNAKEVNDLDEDEVISYICHLCVGERFCDGLIARYISDGRLLQLMSRLRDLRTK